MKKIALSLLPLGIFFSSFANAGSYQCLFWEPDQDVKEILIEENESSTRISLINGVHYVRVSLSDELGLSIALLEKTSKNLISVARGKSSTEVSLSVQDPRFSFSCYEGK